MKIVAQLIPKLKMPEILRSAPNMAAPGPVMRVEPATGAKKDGGDPVNRYQSSIQLGAQESQRDGPGVQLQLCVSVRTSNFFPNTNRHAFLQGTHSEVLPCMAFGFPPGGQSNIVTWQGGVTIQPLTDWLVIQKRLHLFTPTIGPFFQIPLNPGAASPPDNDPASHKRLGFSAGAELFHVDVKDGLSIGVSGQESGYFDFTDRRFHWDPSVLGFIQGNLWGWGNLKPTK